MELLISIIVPVYNVAPYLERCVSSLLGQSYEHFEVILVNDGSTDESQAICERFARSDARVHLVVKENGGLASARNVGMGYAAGDYIGFVDGDDWVRPDMLQRLADIARTVRPDMIRFGYQKMLGGKVTGTYALPYPEGLCEGERLKALQLDTVSYEPALDYSRARILSAWGGVYRRELLEEADILFVSEREILNEDYLFVLQASLAARSIYICREAFYYYDTRANSITTVYRTEMYRRKQALYERYRALLAGRGNDYNARLACFYIDCVYACIVNECTSQKPAGSAIRAIRTMLEDRRLKQCLDRCGTQDGPPKARGICWLMGHRLAGCIYWGYRLAKLFRGANRAL